MRLIELCNQIEGNLFLTSFGKVNKVHRNYVLTKIPGAKVGSLCKIQTENREIPLEIVSLDPKGHIAMPLDGVDGVRLGDRVVLDQESSVPVGPNLLGKVIDSMCVPYDNSKGLTLPFKMPLYHRYQNPMEREVISQALDLGVRSLNACLTCGKGQRQGIFAGSGVGKSVLLGMMARYTQADVVVIALIGERGREVKEFIERELGPEALKKSVIVVETADRSAVRRARGAYVASSIAEYFKDQGADVLLLMDSLTRFAMAQREIGLTAGEPPTSKGYPPSVFGHLSRLVERAGNWGTKGSITGLYTVLVEGDDLEDPVADSARAILDGHIVLSRKLANRGQYPAVDVLSSVSRVMDQVSTKEQVERARKLKSLISVYDENEDAIHYGMYIRGTDPRIDESMECEPKIRDFLNQQREVSVSIDQASKELEEILKV